MGRELCRLLPGALHPSTRDFDVTDYQGMCSYAAAYTFTQRDAGDPLRAIDVNIAETCNIAKLCMAKKWRLLYISTDYVFRGDWGNYLEEDAVHPFNCYAWSKLGGECAVRFHDQSLIVRATFGPKPFPFNKAFTDQWTSKLDVSVLAVALEQF